MNLIWESKSFKPENVLTTYARLQSNGEVLMVEVNKRHKTIREWWQHVSDIPKDAASVLVAGQIVHFSGMTMDQRKAA